MRWALPPASATIASTQWSLRPWPVLVRLSVPQCHSSSATVEVYSQIGNPKPFLSLQSVKPNFYQLATVCQIACLIAIFAPQLCLTGGYANLCARLLQMQFIVANKYHHQHLLLVSGYLTIETLRPEVYLDHVLDRQR